jgi:hypothetical protein
MPLYYFHIYNDDVTLDPEGTELADEEAAMALATKEARILAAETVRHGHFVGDHRVEVTDEERNPIGYVRFDEAVNVSTVSPAPERLRPLKRPKDRGEGTAH